MCVVGCGLRVTSCGLVEVFGTEKLERFIPYIKGIHVLRNPQPATRQDLSFCRRKYSFEYLLAWKIKGKLNSKPPNA